MTLALVHSRALDGLMAPPVTVEVHLANGLPSFTLVGLADTEVKEARERVRAALSNSGLEFPYNKRITVNLAPADLPKESGRFDLAIAIGILAAMGHISIEKLAPYELIGELSLGGELRAIRGSLAMALGIRRHDKGAGRALILPAENAREAGFVDGLKVIGVTHLLEVVDFLRAGKPPKQTTDASAIKNDAAQTNSSLDIDFRDVKGQGAAKRALEVAAAGGHSLLMVGPPGTGKSMLAQRLASVLPPLSNDEALESAAVLSLAGHFEVSQWRRRVVRSPHHTASSVALVGGGSPPRPGEISLAHRGILFLDELPEFPRAALEALREPLETGQITISRATRRHNFPANFQLVAAMNPCPCGYLGHPVKPCQCTPEKITKYQSKLSGPLMDRIDVLVEVPAVAPEILAQAAQGETSEQVAGRVFKARERQWTRQGVLNSNLEAARIDDFVQAAPDSLAFLQSASIKLGWSGRAFHRVLRLARTLADLAQEEQVHVRHMAEAIQFRRALPETKRR